MLAACLVAAALVYVYGDKLDAWIVLIVTGLAIGMQYVANY